MRQKRSNHRQKGFVISAEIILIATIMVLCMIVGLTGVRDAIVTELADVGDAIGNIAQSYSYYGVTGHHASTNGSAFQDVADTCDNDAVIQAGTNSRCVVICDGANAQVDGESTTILAFSP